MAIEPNKVVDESPNKTIQEEEKEQEQDHSTNYQSTRVIKCAPLLNDIDSDTSEQLV